VLRWLGTLPDGVVFVIFGAVAILLTFAFDYAMRRFVKPETRQRSSATASATLQVTATIYAILIAFVIVDAYSQVGTAQSEVSSKAASLAVVYENSRGLPEPEATEMRKASIAYAKGVVNHGIPQLESTGEPTLGVDKELDEMFRIVRRIEPATASDQAAYDATVRALDDIVVTRTKLIDAARPTIPAPLLLLLVVIGLVVMAVATLLDTQHRGSHLFMLSALAMVIWFTLALVVSLDYPFSGLIRVSDTPIHEFIDFRAAR
jgi:hypothetical protein